MIAIPPRPLEAAPLEALAKLQQLVGEQGDYVAQVTYAKTSWGRKPKALFATLKGKLAIMCSGNRRCTYCEDSLADEIEHMRPKDLYPDQAYVWENYVLACGPCNGPKNNRFAVLDAAAELIDVSRKPKDDVVPPVSGVHALVNPRIEDPLELLWLDFRTWRYVPKIDDEASAAWKRAAYTIRVLRLNDRDELVRGRRAASTNFVSRLHRWIEMRTRWSDEEQQGFVADFRAERYRGVWERLKRGSQAPVEVVREVEALLTEAPEARGW
ncbi:MAG: HNH endonuclease [Rhizobacter sp.]